MDRKAAVVVGVDFSACSKSAVMQAARIARCNGAALHVVHVIETLVANELVEQMGAGSRQGVEQLIADAQRALTSWLADAALQDDVTVDVVVGSPLEQITELVQRVQAELLVLGVVGMSGPGNGAGTLATKCARRGRDRVLLVHQEHAEAFQTVVAAVDFSEPSRIVLEQAARVAVQDGSALHVIHVFAPPWHRLHYGAPTREATPDFRAQYTAGLQLRLASCLEQISDKMKGFEGQGLPAEPLTELVEAESHGRGIVSYARQRSADLVVVGTQGRTGLRHVLMGSTAERVLKDTSSSVLLVRCSG